MAERWTLVRHEPKWQPAEVVINANGDTRSGFTCVHQLENDTGPCGGTVFTVEDAIGDHSCLVYE